MQFFWWRCVVVSPVVQAKIIWADWECLPCVPALQLADLIAEAGPDAVIDIDNALCRESLQVIGARAPPA